VLDGLDCGAYQDKHKSNSNITLLAESKKFTTDGRQYTSVKWGEGNADDIMNTEYRRHTWT